MAEIALCCQNNIDLKQPTKGGIYNPVEYVTLSGIFDKQETTDDIRYTSGPERCSIYR
jgi:hypothetical protein